MATSTWRAIEPPTISVDEFLVLREQEVLIIGSGFMTHPPSEHYTPLFVALGAGNDTSPVQTTIDGYAMGLAKRSFQIA
jgi:aromatic ring-opening dioxygenase catalytic subunit (LigB family)